MSSGSHSAIDARVRELHKCGIEATNSGRPVPGAQALRVGLLLLGWLTSRRRRPRVARSGRL